MDEPTILFVKPKAIKSADKKTLAAAGVVVIEIADPQDAKLVRAGTEISGSELVHVSMMAIKSSTVALDAFGRGMNEALLAKSAPVRDPQ